jgi:multidrug resistance protein MdtO
MSAAVQPSDWRGAFVEIARLVGPRPGRLAYASRLALICALTTLVVQIYQTPDPALTAYVAFFLNKPDRVESLIVDVVLTILITAIVGLLMLLTMLVIDAPVWRVAVMSALSVGLLTVAFGSKLRPVAGIIMLILGYGLDVIATFQSGELANRAVLYVWLFVAIPAGVSVVVNLLLAPPPRRLAERALAARVRVAATMLRAPDQRTREVFAEYLREGTAEIQGWLKFAATEKTSPPRDIAALRQAMQSTTAILAWVDVVTRMRAGLLPAPLLEQLAQTLEAMAQVLLKGGYPLEIAVDAHIGESPLPAHSAGLWADMRGLLARFAEPPMPDSSPTQPAAPPGGFFMPDLFTNPEYVHYALKTTGAAMFCYALYSLLDWPGIHTCLITCYIVALGTSAETIEKFILRIAGCLIGGAAGIAAIVYVIPDVTSIGGLLSVVFLVALASAWIAAGSPRISYAGFQIAFAFFLCVIQGPAPAFDLSIARDRVIGILLGNLVVYLIFTRLWPVSVAKRIDPAIASVLRRLSAMAAAASPTTRRSVAAQVQGALGSIEQDLDLAGYEPAAIRPEESWLRARRRASHELAALQGPLLLSADRDPACAVDIGHRLERIAARLSAQQSIPSPVAQGPRAVAEDNDRREETDGAAQRKRADRSPLTGMLRSYLTGLEEALDPNSPAVREAGRERTAGHAAA